jgi:hypothetical protein
MKGLLYNYFMNDHRRLDALFDQATRDSGQYDKELYNQFRAGLLKHIKMEETILFPSVQKMNAGKSTSLLARLRLDHGALTALMVPPPSAVIIRAVRFILKGHNELEEEPEGLYDQCDEMNQDVIQELMRKFEVTTDVPLVPHRSEPFVLDAMRRAMKRAGYNYNDFEDAK